MIIKIDFKNLITNLISAIIVGVIMAVVLAAVVGIFYLAGKAECNALTKDIGFASRYSLYGRCQIEVQKDQWIPLDNYYFKQE